MKSMDSKEALAVSGRNNVFRKWKSGNPITVFTRSRRVKSFWVGAKAGVPTYTSQTGLPAVSQKSYDDVSAAISNGPSGIPLAAYATRPHPPLSESQQTSIADT